MKNSLLSVIYRFQKGIFMLFYKRISRNFLLTRIYCFQKKEKDCVRLLFDAVFFFYEDFCCLS